jgi:secreted trypsin-like serine protease
MSHTWGMQLKQHTTPCASVNPLFTGAFVEGSLLDTPRPAKKEEEGTHDMAANKVIREPLWATIMGALVTAMVGVGAAFFVFVQSGEAAPQAATDKQPPPSASVSPKIVGGTEVPTGKYPFMVLLDFRVKGQPIALCAGTLIDQDSVLTAAHCLYQPKGTKLQVIVGRTVRSSNQGQVRGVKWGAIHPAYNTSNKKRSFAYDAAVLKLRRPVSGITPIKLATLKHNDLEKPGRNATVAGWGNEIASSPYDRAPPGGPEIPDRMHEAQVPIVSDSSAEQAYDPRPETRLTRKVEYSPLVQIAAGGKGKNSPCHGDSGGPLFVAGAPDGGGDTGGSSGKYTQIGIASFSSGGCAYRYFPVVYTEVNNPKISNWILSAARR